ncbi:hypothetical protein BKA60DRAFT_241626 [Fusarium oxysporum]|nr:hypothetical protein BKA60DRAFT_241626 [Fusarium oxysporum]
MTQYGTQKLLYEHRSTLNPRSFSWIVPFSHLILLLSLSRPFSFLLFHFLLEHLGLVAFWSSCISFIPSVRFLAGSSIHFKLTLGSRYVQPGAALGDWLIATHTALLRLLKRIICTYHVPSLLFVQIRPRKATVFAWS